jgi:hypothetical protein
MCFPIYITTKVNTCFVFVLFKQKNPSIKRVFIKDCEKIIKKTVKVAKEFLESDFGFGAGKKAKHSKLKGKKYSGL